MGLVVVPAINPLLVSLVRRPFYAMIWYAVMTAVCYHFALGNGVERGYAEWGWTDNGPGFVRVKRVVRVLSLTLFAIVTIRMAVLTAQAIGFLPAPGSN